MSNPIYYVEGLMQKYPEIDSRIDLDALNTVLRSAVRGIDCLVGEAARTEREHGFGTQTPGEDIALMHSELSEAFEEIRAGHKPSELYYSAEPGKDLKPEGVPAELADCIIRIFGFCRRHNVDLADAIVRKMLFNETRPFKHGGKAL